MTIGRAPHVHEIAEALRERYKDFAHYNKQDPLEELLFIVCSVKTTEVNYHRTFEALLRAFPNRQDLATATVQEIAQPLKIGGLANQKARLIRGFIDRILEEFGTLTLDPLETMTDEQCEEFLLSLPGAGRKVARCVMLYALDRQVFPVDTHVCRVSSRLGWGMPSRSDNACSQKDMDRLQSMIPPELRFSLHVNMVSLGREICTKVPKCSQCPISAYCPKEGVSIST